MTKKEKKEEAKRLAEQMAIKHGKPPVKELTDEEKKEKRRREIRARDHAKERRRNGNILGSVDDRWKDWDKW